ncbi:hypothetical protein ACXLRS_000052 [Citrobacter youngae]|uniref:hypothetical protein n=1 Tax=Citrobacter sp. FDAARGOS_156 TaxID=1702170 RepID=UPI00115EDCD8|nr:hypothetical protein [Citrobacter sp. FDAARGOS_156]MBJ9204623.1 hypothetical protein [Citrobacter sp. FDAARGOS_156]TRL71456.1 hypothetical protein FMM65_10940 [Citrobacter youngae]
MHSTAGWLAMLQSVVWQRDVNQQMIAYRDGWRFSGGAFLTRLQLLPGEGRVGRRAVTGADR